MTYHPDPDADGWSVVLRPLNDPLYPADSKYHRAGAYRLKLALKVLLRGFGLRCVSVGKPPAAVDPAGDGK